MSRTWKDSFLSSGVPLEHSIRESLKNLDLEAVQEYSYERLNEEGSLKTFTIDIYGQYFPQPSRNLCVEYFIEAKYANDSKNWFFMPKKLDGDIKLDEFYIVLDSLVEESRVNKEFSWSYNTIEQLVSEGGVVIEDNGKNETHAIYRGIQQLRYALIHHTIEVLKSQLFGLSTEKQKILILVPILVTTAKLWRVKPGITIEDIRATDDMATVAKEQEYLVLFEQPNNQMSRYSLNLIDKMIKNELSGDLTRLLENVIPRLANHDFVQFVDKFHKNMPKFFLVANYNYFNKGIKNSLDSLRNNVIIPR